jgi:hypothetical protein
MSLGGASSAWADAINLPYSYGFEESSPTGWTKTSCASGTNNYQSGSSSHSGNYVFKFAYNTNPPQYLISPELAVSANSVKVSLWYKNPGSYTETFNVGYSTTNAETGSFTWLASDITASSSWTKFEETFPVGTKFVAIKYTANNQLSLYIDDFIVEENETYPKPKAFTFTGYTSTSASFTWTNGGEETAWQIAYSTTQGFDAASVSPVDITTNPYTLEGLTAETTYYARIRADYGGGNYSNWSDEISFKPSAAINTIVNNGSSTTTGYNLIPFHTYYTDGKIDKSQFIIPAASLSSITDRQITKLTFHSYQANASFGTTVFKVYLKETDASAFDAATFDYSDMEEVYSGNVSISGNQMVITLDTPFDYGNGNLKVGFEMTTKGTAPSTYNWYGISAVGNVSIYSYLYNSGTATSGLSSFLPKMTITSLPQVATVKKPKNLDDTATTTTTATLGWTNGSDETAWQIAYSTDTDFDPDTEGTKVAADANPFTLTELTAGTTYYAYVRAKKAEEYSDWSNKADFTTLAATPVIELSATNHNFGLVSDADAQALTLTISNTGGAALTGLTVTASSGFAVTDAEGNALTATTIDASSTLTVKVKVSALGQQDGTITIDGNEIEAKQVTVSGYKLDDTKILETFASASSVSRWTVASGWTFNASTGAYAGTSSRTMTSPKLAVAEGNVLALNVKLGWSGGSLIVEGSSDNGSTWTAFDAKTYNSSNGGLNTSSYVLLNIDDIPTTVNKIRLTGYYAYINVFNGFTYVNEPVLGIFSNEACTSVQASPATNNFGFAAEAQNQLYYIKNTGNGQIDLTIEQADGFTAAVDDAALTEGEKATLTITMTATEGLHDGTITVTAKNHDNDDVLGTFVINANGGITGTKNNVVLTAFPAGWQNNNWTISNGAARNWSSTSSDLITTTLTVTEGEKLLVEAYKYYSDENSQLSYSYSTDGGSNWSDPVSLTNQLTTSYKIIAISGIPAGNVLMKFSGTYTYIRQIYGFEAFAEPILEFAAEGTTKNFGMITSNTTSDDYTVTNSGTAKLEGFGVTCDNSSFDIAITGNVDEIAAGGSATFTVTMNTSDPGEQYGIVTISGTGVADKTFNVKGYVADGTKIFTTFAALPDRWTNTGNYWSFSANGATATSSSSKLESPKITIAEGQKLAISAMQRYSGSSYYVTINGSSDNGATWTAYTKTLNDTQLNNTDYTVVELDDIPTTVNKLQLVGYYVYVNGLNGFAYDDNDPQFAMFSDSECTASISEATATNSWGFVNEDKTATYYIKNTGTGTMSLSKSDTPTGFTATLGAASLGAGESTSLVISMANDAANNEGYHAGDVVLTAKDNADNTLGTFTVTSSGVVVGSKTDINFTTLSAFPAGWEGDGWSVTANTKATTTSYNKTLTTGTYTVAAGESLVIEGKGNSSWSSPSLTYQYSTDGGTNWTTGTSTLSFSYSATNYSIQTISDIPAGSVKIKFTGSYMDIQRIYGYTAVLEPVMALSPAATSYDFGMQTAAADYEITVTNSGTAAMENLTAALSGDDAADFEVALSIPDGSSATITDGKANVPVGQTVKVTATMKASTEYKEHNATLTISADGLADKVIALKGKTRDASKNYIDFASEIPSSFVEKGAWTVSSGAAYSGSGESSLITQPINLATGEKIYFDAKKPSYGSPSLQVRYSVNGGISWSDYVDYTAAISTSGNFSSHEIDLENTSAVTAIVEFRGYYYMYLDNIYGGVLNNEAPMISVTKSAAIVENGATEAFGSIMSEATATYTITNVGNGTLTITDPVTKTGAATVTVNKTSLANGESATLIITMPVEAPYEYKDGVVTVVTNLGDFVINYNATILNPNALDEQFASGQPAGWYFGGYWSVASTQACNDDGTISDLITEQLHVAGTSDALTFQAKRTSNYTAPTWSVAYSTDRVNWTDVDVSGYTLSYNNYTTITVNGLAEGDYYLRIRANRLYVDNFLGWTKKNNTRDLYVTATSFPASTDMGNDATITATVTSLIAAETGVYAKLFINDAEEATAVAQDIALNGTKTFSFTYAIPENKTAQIKVYYSDDTEAFATAEHAMKVNYTLAETVDPITITAGTYDVVLTRNFNAGWNTVCLPFAVTDIEEFFGADAKVYEFNDFAGDAISFSKVTETAAATPYLVYAPAEKEYSSVTLPNVTLSDAAAGTVTKNGVTFQGTYATMAAGKMTGKYGVTAAGKIAKAGANASLKGFRAYFEGVPATARIFIDGEATGIGSITADGELQMENVYNLNGQRVENAHKGLYIVNGKKVVVK